LLLLVSGTDIRDAGPAHFGPKPRAHTVVRPYRTNDTR